MNKYVGILTAALLFSMSACSGIKSEAKYPTGADRSLSKDSNDIYSKQESIFGEGGITGIFGEKKKETASSDGAFLGVNSYLWRASLDTISFLPLVSADPFGGVIITDWYRAPESEERYKLNVFVTEPELTANALKVSIFKQQKRGSEWVDMPVTAADNIRVEDAILTRARQMKVANL